MQRRGWGVGWRWATGGQEAGAPTPLRSRPSSYSGTVQGHCAGDCKSAAGGWLYEAVDIVLVLGAHLGYEVAYSWWLMSELAVEVDQDGVLVVPSASFHLPHLYFLVVSPSLGRRPSLR